MAKLSLALGATLIAATLLSRTAVALVPDQPPTAAAAAPAASCRSGGAGVTVVPGEIVSSHERDARVGWLALTYIGDTRTALDDDRVREAVGLMARARRLLRAAEACAQNAGDAPAAAAETASSLASAEQALATGDRTSAIQDVTAAGDRLRPWVIGLDATLFPGYRGGR